MKKLLITGMLGLFSFGAFAGTASTEFKVNLALTPSCIITSSATSSTPMPTTYGTGSPTDIGITYTAFQANPGLGSTGFFVRCSQGLSYGIALNGASVTDGVSGLNYTMAITTTNSDDGSTPVASVASQTGAAGGTQWYVKAYVPAGQAGTTTAGTANNVRMVTVTY